MRRSRGLLSLLCLFVASPETGAYHFIQAVTPSGETVELSWASSSSPVPYWVNNTRPLDFSLDEAVGAVQQSFDVWEDVDTATITFELAGTTPSEPFVFFDNQSTLGFTDDPDLATPGVLGATLSVYNIFSGEIVESDIFFSNLFVWSVDPGGEPGTFDFVSVATHEIGHFFGLDHSDVGFMTTEGFGRQLVSGSAIMFPFSFGPANVEGRVLTTDDRAAVSLAYPTGAFLQLTGTLAGTITKGGRGVGFAHVIAFNPFSGETIGAFADASGNYEIGGLEPGPHTVRVNPISDPASPPDFGFPENATDLDFRDTLFDAGTAAVTPSGVTSGIDVEVRP